MDACPAQSCGWADHSSLLYIPCSHGCPPVHLPPDCPVLSIRPSGAALSLLISLLVSLLAVGKRHSWHPMIMMTRYYTSPDSLRIHVHTCVRTHTYLYLPAKYTHTNICICSTYIPSKWLLKAMPFKKFVLSCLQYLVVFITCGCLS